MEVFKIESNVFLKTKKELTLEEYMNYNPNGRDNLGDYVPILVYRLMEYSLRVQMDAQFGTYEQIHIFRNAGYRAGEFFAKNMLDTNMDLNVFISLLQRKMEELKIGVLRIEKIDKETGNIQLTVSEDADCSGLPLLGETICNYDEGFISGVLSTYFKKPYTVNEVDCWATGDRVCRFLAEPNREDNCELLFGYLKSIIYDTPIIKPNLDKLDSSFHKLSEGMEFLQRAVEEMKTYTADLSNGNLSSSFPSVENFLCSNLKGLHANLMHLTWQAKQVAAGDYSQHVSYLGDFSDAFNTMIQQLKEREAQLKEEAKKIQKRAHVIDEYNAFLIEVTRKRNEWIFVVNAETSKILYCNKQEHSDNISEKNCLGCKQRLDFRNRIINWTNVEQDKVWEIQDNQQRFYRVTTFHIEWQGDRAFAHIIEDITNDKIAAKKLAIKAYQDPLTGIHNRLFFYEYMKELLKEKRNAILYYMDLDGLKYVNDNFGHNEGDEYIRSFVSIIEQSVCSINMFARIGGDEFCIVFLDSEKMPLERMIAETRQRFMLENKRSYPVSFSYGSASIKGADQPYLDDIIKIADRDMYEFKMKMKKKE